MILSNVCIKQLIMLSAFVICQPVFAQQTADTRDTTKVEGKAMLNDVRLDIIYDNYPHPEGEVALWGFSCLIRNTPKTILFDTGGLGDSLLANMDTLGIDPKIIEQVVISHDHRDHTGGLERLIPHCQSPDVILLDSFSAELKQEVKTIGGKVTEISSSTEICPGVFTTGRVGEGVAEQALVLQTRGGLIVITGCAHPGVVNIVRRAKEIVEGEIVLVMGGFHLLQHSREAVGDIISQLQDLSVQYVAPTHCTGEIPRQIFKDAYSDKFIELEIGSIITLSDLMDKH